MKTYRALNDGYLGNVAVKVLRKGVFMKAAHIRKGDIFEWDGIKGLWMEPVAVEIEEPVEKEPIETPYVTLSGLQKAVGISARAEDIIPL